MSLATSGVLGSNGGRVQAHIFNVVPGTPWTTANVPANTTLVSMSVVIITGTAVIVDADGTTVPAIPAGYSASWNNGGSPSLLPLQSVTATTGRTIVTMDARG